MGRMAGYPLEDRYRVHRPMGNPATYCLVWMDDPATNRHHRHLLGLHLSDLLAL